MNEQPVSVTQISWQDLCPWTIIFKTLSIALSPSVLVWALLGVVLTPMGWFVAERLTFNEEMTATISHVAAVNRSPYQSVFQQSETGANALEFLGAKLSGPRLVFDQLVRPFRALMYGGLSTREFVYFLLGGIWTLLIWSFAGCAITRVSLLRLTRNEPIGIDDAFDFTVEKYLNCISAVAMPLVAIALICIPMFLIGLVMATDLGAMVFGLLWFVVLMASAVMAFLAIGLMFGWPLIVSSISAEGQNSFDAVTRAYAYTVQRPINYLGYVLVAVFFGGFCWLIASYAADRVVDLGYWSTSFGSGMFEDRAEIIRGDLNPTVVTENQNVESAVSWSLETGRNSIRFWNGFVRTLAAAFLYGLFWCIASAIYLLLRHDVDETEMDEIYLEDEQRTYDLPPLKSDELGIPQVIAPVSDPKSGATGENQSSDD